MATHADCHSQSARVFLAVICNTRNVPCRRRARPDLNQGLADLLSAAPTTVLCTRLLPARRSATPGREPTKKTSLGCAGVASGRWYACAAPAGCPATCFLQDAATCGHACGLSFPRPSLSRRDVAIRKTFNAKTCFASVPLAMQLVIERRGFTHGQTKSVSSTDAYLAPQEFRAGTVGLP